VRVRAQIRIDAEPYRVGPRTAKLKRLLVKLEPETEKPAVFPPPMPSKRPSLLYAKINGSAAALIGLCVRHFVQLNLFSTLVEFFGPNSKLLLYVLDFGPGHQYSAAVGNSPK
jgi:hypothetical protein